jgi:hypothetical protein
MARVTRANEICETFGPRCLPRSPNSSDNVNHVRCWRTTGNVRQCPLTGQTISRPTSVFDRLFCRVGVKLQAESEEMEGWSCASVSALAWNIVLLAIMDIRTPDLILRGPERRLGPDHDAGRSYEASVN